MAAWLVPLITQVGIPLLSSMLGGKGGGGAGGAGGMGNLFQSILGGLGGAGGAGGGGGLLQMGMSLLQNLLGSRQQAIPSIAGNMSSGPAFSPIK